MGFGPVKKTIVCPHCSSTGTHNFLGTIGSQSATCKACNKTFKVTFDKNQEVTGTSRN